LQLKLFTSLYPTPAAYEVEAEVVSTFPITIELALGVKEVTEAVVEPVADEP
jgi:hypothetical protein